MVGKVFGRMCSIVTARKRSLGQGNIFIPVCHSVHRGACVVGGGGGPLARVVAGGACVVAGGGVYGCQGACVVAGGACLVAGGGGACVGYDEIRSMSGRYASYWNAFLFFLLLH